MIFGTVKAIIIYSSCFRSIILYKKKKIFDNDVSDYLSLKLHSVIV